MYIKGYLQPTPGKNSLSANQVIWGVQMGNIKHNRHLHSRVTEEGKHFFSCKEIVMFSILITEKTKMHQLCLGISQCISLQMSFSTCTQYWYLCPRNSLFPQLSHREFWMPCGDDLGRTSEMGWRETGFLFSSGFRVVRTAEWLLHPSAHLLWERAEQREHWGSRTLLGTQTPHKWWCYKSHSTAMCNYTDLLRKWMI